MSLTPYTVATPVPCMLLLYTLCLITFSRSMTTGTIPTMATCLSTTHRAISQMSCWGVVGSSEGDPQVCVLVIRVRSLHIVVQEHAMLLDNSPRGRIAEESTQEHCATIDNRGEAILPITYGGGGEKPYEKSCTLDYRKSLYGCIYAFSVSGVKIQTKLEKIPGKNVWLTMCWMKGIY